MKHIIERLKLNTLPELQALTMQLGEVRASGHKLEALEDIYSRLEAVQEALLCDLQGVELQ